MAIDLVFAKTPQAQLIIMPEDRPYDAEMTAR